MLVADYIKDGAKSVLNWDTLCFFSYENVLKQAEPIHVCEKLNDLFLVLDIFTKHKVSLSYLVSYLQFVS